MSDTLSVLPLAAGSGWEKVAFPKDRRRPLATSERNVESSLPVETIYTTKRRSIQIQEPHGSIKPACRFFGADAVVRRRINGKALELFDDLWRMVLDLSVSVN